MNVTERILARASGRKRVEPGDVVVAGVDKAMVHDVSGPGVIKVFERLREQGIDTGRLWDPSRVWIAEDHFVPSAEKASAENIVKLQDFAEKYGVGRHFKYGMGQYGICHTLSHEEAMVMPGEVYVGGDSHTNTTGALGAFACGLGHTDVAYVLLHGRIWFKVPPTALFVLRGAPPAHVMAKDLILRILGDIGTDGAAYGAMQFAGDGVYGMPVEERLTLTNMTTEAGAKNGIIEPDRRVFDYIGERAGAGAARAAEAGAAYGDADASYESTREYDAAELEPMVASPFSPDNVGPARDSSSVELDKAYIGSCTGAKMHDLEAAARVLKGRTVKVRTEVLPAAMSIYRRAVESGLVGIFAAAGAVVGPPTCGACCGAHMGVLAKGEVCVSTTNRNFPGRMGHPESRTYLASPQVAAASAVTGRITDPRDLD